MQVFYVFLSLRTARFRPSYGCRAEIRTLASLAKYKLSYDVTQARGKGIVGNWRWLFEATFFSLAVFLECAGIYVGIYLTLITYRFPLVILISRKRMILIHLLGQFKTQRFLLLYSILYSVSSSPAVLYWNSNFITFIKDLNFKWFNFHKLSHFCYFFFKQNFYLSGSLKNPYAI